MINANQSAYPTVQSETVKYEGGFRDGRSRIKGGLTKRELIAAMCLSGFGIPTVRGDSPLAKMTESEVTAEFANISVKRADALLAELSKESGPAPNRKMSEL